MPDQMKELEEMQKQHESELQKGRGRLRPFSGKRAKWLILAYTTPQV